MLFVFEENEEKGINVNEVSISKDVIDSIVAIFNVKREDEEDSLSNEDCINQNQKKIVINVKMLD